MKQINNFITEKLHLGKNTKVEDAKATNIEEFINKYELVVKNNYKDSLSGQIFNIYDIDIPENNFVNVFKQICFLSMNEQDEYEDHLNRVFKIPTSSYHVVVYGNYETEKAKICIFPPSKIYAYFEFIFRADCIHMECINKKPFESIGIKIIEYVLNDLKNSK